MSKSRQYQVLIHGQVQIVDAEETSTGFMRVTYGAQEETWSKDKLRSLTNAAWAHEHATN